MTSWNTYKPTGAQAVHYLSPYSNRLHGTILHYPIHNWGCITTFIVDGDGDIADDDGDDGDVNVDGDGDDDGDDDIAELAPCCCGGGRGGKHSCGSRRHSAWWGSHPHHFDCESEILHL